MSAHCNTRLHSPLRTVLGKHGDWYQAYCATYKTHAMATSTEAQDTSLNRSLDVLTEDTECPDIDNNSNHSSDATVALGDPEAVGQPEDPAYQDRFTTLTKEINDLHQRVTTGEGQPAEALDCIQQ